MVNKDIFRISFQTVGLLKKQTHTTHIYGNSKFFQESCRVDLKVFQCFSHCLFPWRCIIWKPAEWWKNTALMKQGSAPICPPTRKFQQLDAMRTSFYIMTQAGLNPYLMNDQMNCMRYCYTSSHVFFVFFCFTSLCNYLVL